MTRLVILGAGGHGLVVLDAALAAQRAGHPLLPVGLVDDRAGPAGTTLLGVPIVGPVSSLSSVPHDGTVVAVGDNAIRQRLFHQLAAGGEPLLTVIHPSAIVAASAVLGRGSMLLAGAIVNPLATVGDNVIVNTAATVEHHCRIGDHVHLAPGTHLGGNVTIGMATLVGIGATVLPGVTIGEHCMVGAGAVVTQDVQSGTTVVGVPARVVHSWHA